MRNTCLLTASIVVCGMLAIAQPKQEEQKRDSTGAGMPNPVQVVTHHEITINGIRFSYTATAGTFLLKSGEDGADRVNRFHGVHKRWNRIPR